MDDDPPDLISIDATDWPDFETDAALYRQAAAAARAFAGAAGEISIRLDQDAAVQSLNKTYRCKDKPTNVLSFPSISAPGGAGPSHNVEDSVLGDLILARETCAREAREQGKSLAQHTAHLIVHGVLHFGRV